MIKQAIIMAGGLGSRLKDRTVFMPKGFIEIDGNAIVEMSINKLFSAGIEDIIIGTGHCNDWYDRLAEKYHCIRCIYNDRYADTGSMATLARCVPFINSDCLVLESDLIYDAIGLTVLINDQRRNVILASGTTQSGDEVYLEADVLGNLVHLSKNRSAIGIVSGELVGITRLTRKTLDMMVTYYSAHLSDQPKMDYEMAMAAISSSTQKGLHKIAIRTVENYAWREIDDEIHLAMAKTSVYPVIRENESLRLIRREVLLNPGPALTTDSVKYAQVCADICPRETEFGDVMEWVANELSLMVGNPGNVETVFFGGSGTAADEVMISSCIPDDAKTLVVDNGAYGARFSQMSSVYRLNFDVWKSSSFLPLDVPALKDRLLDGKYTHFVIVYHETTTGLLNQVPELCRFCHEHSITTIVDAVSAFAAIPIDMERDGIDFMASTSNKNIQGMAGIAFVFCRNEALERIKTNPVRSFYLNLWDQYTNFQKTHQTRFTPPVQSFYALRQAIIETKIETIPRRYERYCSCWDILVQSIRKCGLEMLVPIEAQSKLITAVIEPTSPKYHFETFHDLARSNAFTIYPGKLSDANTFRIANIGNIFPEDMKTFTTILESYMEEL